MALIIQKYGGTSVGTLERIEKVAEKIQSYYQNKHQLVVVVSAMAGETDRLIQLAQTLQTQPDAREYSMLVSTGEQIAIALLALALIKRGVPARSYTGWQAGIQTTDVFKNARIKTIEAANLKQDIAEGVVSIVAGFQGVDSKGNITTLGRGGSDTTAVAIAATLKADECQIYTDVEGVYTADPHIVPEAQLLTHIAFEEMLELASLGAKVIQDRAVQFAVKYQVPLRILSSFTDGPGTLITYGEARMEQPLISGVTSTRQEAKITLVNIPNQPDVIWKILQPLAQANIHIGLMVQNGGTHSKCDFTFTINRDDYERTLSILDTVSSSIGAEQILSDKKIGKLSIVGVGLRSQKEIVNSMFQTLAKEGISIQLISTSEINLSVIIDEKYLELAVRALHSAFGLDVKHSNGKS